MLNKIIELINSNRICTTEICDAMDKTGVLPGITALNQGLFAVGKVKYVFAHSGTNYNLHRQLESVEQDSIVFVDAIDCEGRAVFGDLVSKYLQLYCGVRAIVTNGAMRDAHRLIKEQRPVWCSTLTPVGCHNRDIPIPKDVQEKVDKRKEFYHNSIMVCDDSGVALIPHDQVNEEFERKLHFIEAQEDVWYFCVDTLKWDTYRTVALKEYMKKEANIPGFFLERLKRGKL